MGALAPTSSNKRRHAQNIVLYSSYAGGISEGKSFSLDREILLHNKRALDILVETIRRENGEPLSLPTDRAYPGSHFWRDVPWATVAETVTTPSSSMSFWPKPALAASWVS